MGDRWIGLAAGEAEGGLATPLRTLRRSSRQADVEAIRRAAAAEGAAAVVVGLPRHMNGALGEQARRTMAFGEALAAAGLRVIYGDERLSSAAAEEYVTERRGRRPRPGERLDHVAAALILQEYLDHPGHAETAAGGV